MHRVREELHSTTNGGYSTAPAEPESTPFVLNFNLYAGGVLRSVWTVLDRRNWWRIHRDSQLVDDLPTGIAISLIRPDPDP